MIIRSATAADIAAIVALGRLMHVESAMAFLPFKTEKVERYLRNLTTNQRNCLIVAESGDGIVGAIGGFLTDYFFCDETLAIDTGLFVQSEFRGTSAAIRLIRRFIEWAKEKGVAEVCLSVSTGVEIEKSHRMFVGLGLAHVGGVYKLRTRPGVPERGAFLNIASGS
jgi:GNAT superfamily N-acetyltransferase